MTIRISRDGEELATVDLELLEIETEDPALEDMFYQMVDEGVPTLNGGSEGDDKEKELYDEEELVPLGPDSEGLFCSFVSEAGYEINAGDSDKRGEEKEEKQPTRDAAIVVGMGSFEIAGFPIVIEHRAGQERYGKRLPADYGYIRRTGSAEGQDVQMDCFVRDPNGEIFVIDSYVPNTGEFDEHKIMIGYADKAAAVSDFESYYSGGVGEESSFWRLEAPDRRIGYATPVSRDALAAWLDAGDLTRPYYTPSDVRYTPNADPSETRCEHCEYFKDGVCSNHTVHHDPKVPQGNGGIKIVSPSGWCTQYKADFSYERDARK